MAGRTGGFDNISWFGDNAARPVARSVFNLQEASVMSSRISLMCVLALASISSIRAEVTPWRSALTPKGEGRVTLTLAVDGATDCMIVIPEKPTSQEQKAAEDLAQGLKAMTGADFRIVQDVSSPASTAISIGQTRLLAEAKLSESSPDLGDEGYAIDVADKRLFLRGGCVRGPIYAVYALLEEDLNCRWYDRSSARIPRRTTLRFKPVPRSFVPPLRLRDPFYADAWDSDWSLRNRTNAPNARVREEWGGYVDYDGLFVHTYFALVPPDKYFKDHPDYYSMIDGKRTRRQLCETHPEVIRIATEAVLAALKANPHSEIVSVSPEDGGGHCTCPQCQALITENGSPAATVVHLINRIAEAVEAQHPRVLIATLAYLDTIDPPKSLRPRKNTAIQLCNDLHSWRYPFTCFAEDSKPESKRYRDAIVGWSKVTNNIYVWDYFVNFSHYLAPMPNMHVLKPSVDFYLAHNVKGIMFQAAYQGPGERSLMRSWVMAKLLWDPSRDVTALTEDFVRGYFEEAAQPILDYYEALEAARKANMNSLHEPAAGKETTDPDGGCMDVGGIRYAMDSPFLSRELIDRATALFNKAESLAPSDTIRRRVERERLPITYVKLRRGPDFAGNDYPRLIDDFERVARREGLTCLREGSPDLDKKLVRYRSRIPPAK